MEGNTLGMRTPMDENLAVGAAGKRVASYRDVNGAMLALRQLAEQGFPLEHVTVRPAELHAMPDALLDPADAPSRSRAVAAGVLAGLGVMLGLVWAIAGWILPLVIAVVTGIFTAAAWLGVERAYLGILRRRTNRARQLIEAERFDVMCTLGATRANHLLAQWWNPGAPPARVRGS